MIGTITIGFKLTNQKIGEVDVAGLSSLNVIPVSNDELLRKVLMLVESVADPRPVVTFVAPKEVEFFAGCNWYVGRKAGEKFLVASEPIDDSKFKGEVW